MAKEELQHVALPKLFGAPAYARPPVIPVARADRPFDPDELPLESALTEEERRLLAQQADHPEVTAAQAESLAEAEAARRRSLRLPSITGLLRGGGSSAGLTGGVTAADGALATIGGGNPAPVEPDSTGTAEQQMMEGTGEADEADEAVEASG